VPKNWWSRALWIAATYVIAAGLLPDLLLVLVNSVGYLPYSDRPGPGWQSPHFPSAQELQFFAAFAVLLSKGTIFYGLIFAAVGLVLGVCSVPRWVIRVMAALTAFLTSGLMMAAAGWMIAISSAGVYIAAGCGALWGLFLFPRFVSSAKHPAPLAVRVLLVLVIVVGGAYWLVRPLLPDPGLTNAQIEVIRRSNAGEELSSLDLSYLGPSIAKEVKGSGKYTSVNRMGFTTDGRNRSRMLLIIDDAEAMAHTFVVPRSGDAIFRQRDGRWKQEQAAGRNSDIFLKLDSAGGHEVNLELKGPCCSSMTQRIGPYS
jgi:hypothetical protein